VYKRSLLFSFLLIFSLRTITGLAQQYPTNYFQSPLNIPICLAGCFGELRTNHFHTGIDIKTNGVEGLPVHAAAEGYVSRISVSAVGYGNALFITHPNGYTTVYGHLQRYNPDIQNYLRQIQYKTENFEQDVKVDPTAFLVKKGDLVAFSGNTGGSAGAHLHFEIRETKTEKPVNPLLFGFSVPDAIPPVIHAIKIYPLDSNSYVKAVYISVGKKGIQPVTAVYGQNIKIEAYKDQGVYHLKNIAQLQSQGNLGFSIEANDFEDVSTNKIGVYSIELCVNEEEIYLKTMKRLDFDLKRYINTHIDYPERVKTGRWFEKSFVAPSNSLPIYDVLKNKGRVEIKPGNIYHVSYYLNDIDDNSSELAFDITSPDTRQNIVLPIKDYDTLLNYRIANNINKGSVYLNIPQGIFFENVAFSYEELPKPKRAFSKLYSLGNAAIPCEDYFEIGIKPDNLPDRIKDKACILSYIAGYLGGDYDNGWIKAKTRTLGKFFVSADTMPPTIVPINIKNERKVPGSAIKFIIKDNMSGLKTYTGKIDGQWVLFERDAKKSLVYYTFDDHCKSGKHHLEMSATDYKNNTRTLNFDFIN